VYDFNIIKAMLDVMTKKSMVLFDPVINKAPHHENKQRSGGIIPCMVSFKTWPLYCWGKKSLVPIGCDKEQNL
jgi:hypothetical protein